METEQLHIKKTYSQNWPAYNSAQTHEKEKFMVLLKELCGRVHETKTNAMGRPPLPISGCLFASVFKVYSTLSSRRFMTDLRDAQAKGFIDHTPHFNTVQKVLDNEDLTPVLKDLIRISSLPLSAIETNFAVDSSGFTVGKRFNWNEAKYKPDRYYTDEVLDWVKVHIMCGVRTNIITSVEILGRHTHDSIPFPDLVEDTAKNFKIGEVSADKAYCSGYNLDIVRAHGGTAYIPFRSNNKAGYRNDLWQKMFHLFHYRQEEFMAHYHKRSNVEATFSMIKRKFGDRIRSKNEAARVNECLCKILAHNICCLIHESHELGVDISLASN